MANILIVEDGKNMQNIIADYMKKGGHTCFSADDGIDALMFLKNQPMDLLILPLGSTAPPPLWRKWAYLSLTA